MGASQNHLRRVIPWGCTPRPPWRAGQQEKPGKSSLNKQIPQTPLAQALLWGKTEDNIPHVPIVHLEVNQAPRAWAADGHHGSAGTGCQAHPGKGESYFSNVSDSFAVT